MAWLSSPTTPSTAPGPPPPPRRRRPAALTGAAAKGNSHKAKVRTKGAQSHPAGGVGAVSDGVQAIANSEGLAGQHSPHLATIVPAPLFPRPGYALELPLAPASVHRSVTASGGDFPSEGKLTGIDAAPGPPPWLLPDSGDFPFPLLSEGETPFPRRRGPGKGRELGAAHPAKVSGVS
jgi:hypothetical protein